MFDDWCRWKWRWLLQHFLGFLLPLTTVHAYEGGEKKTCRKQSPLFRGKTIWAFNGSIRSHRTGRENITIMSYPVPNFKLSQILAYLILYILSRSSCPIPSCLGYRSEDRKNRAHDLILDLEYDLVGNGKRRDYPAGNEAIKQDIPSYPAYPVL